MMICKTIRGFVDPNRETLIRLAQKVHIRDEWLNAIFSSPDILPRQELCRNPNMKKEVLNLLCIKQKEPELIYDLMANPETSLRSFLHLLRHAKKLDDPFILQFGLIRHGEKVRNANSVTQ